MRQQYGRRSQVLAGALALFALAIVVQMTRIQNSPEADIFRQQSEAYAYEYRTFYPNRGEIYDRKGRLLAGEKIIYEIGVDLNIMTDPHAIAFAVSDTLGMDYDGLMDVMQNPPEGLSYIILVDYVDAEQALYLQELKKALNEQAPEGSVGGLTGLQFKPHPQRSYPENALGSNILGFVSHEGTGYFGVEEKYNDLLAGNPVQVWVPEDPNRAAEIPRVPNGTTLVLTVDRDLQAAAEQSLDQALFDYGAQNGTIIIMDPRTGEILAMATSPRMDLNQFWNYPYIYDESYEFNPAISMQYEPGSVFKILTMASALDMGTVAPNTLFNDTGSIEVGGALIQNWDRRPWGMQDMIGCLQHSLNVCHAWISTSMGESNFYRYIQDFGIGQPTGIDLSGESSGHLKLPGDDDWYSVDLGTNAFGQGVAVTPIQMLTAASALANDGRLVIPHVLYAMVRDGRQFNMSPIYGGNPVGSQAARTVSEMLAISLENEASMALVPGYRIAGKTGTAQIPVNGEYDPNSTNASFIGWGPIDSPQFMIYVWLERPTVSTWANDTAAPLFSEIAQKTLILLGIPPDAIRLQLANQ